MHYRNHHFSKFTILVSAEDDPEPTRRPPEVFSTAHGFPKYMVWESAALKTDHFAISKPNPGKPGRTLQRPCKTCDGYATQQCICSADVFRCELCMRWHVLTDTSREVFMLQLKSFQEKAAKKK